MENNIYINENKLETLSGVGEQRAKYLKKIGLVNYENMIEYYPRDYEDRTKISNISELKDGETAVIIAEAMSDVVNQYIRRNLIIEKVMVRDETGICNISWFNQKYISNMIKRGNRYVFYGKVKVNYGKVSMEAPEVENITNIKNAGAIVPIYPLTFGITQNILRNIARQVFTKIKNIEETFPEWFLMQEKLMSKYQATINMHFPKNIDVLKDAKYRLAFEELFFMQLALLYLKKYNKKEKGSKLDKNICMSELLDKLPFNLTAAQLKVLEEIDNDLESDIAMDRLLQGDVGSGKTIISILACFKTVKSGYQAAVMVPTAILAIQHLESFRNILKEYNFNIEILKSGMKKKEKTEILENLKQGKIDILIGTHALIEENVEFKNLGLVVTDEQHRFGVRQREKMMAKGNNPNILVMSATPIPRTLALILYGDLDISIINELPRGRKEIKTASLTYKEEPMLDKFLSQQIEEGRQGYIVCPLVEENEELDLKSAEERYKEYQVKFPKYNIGLIHGKMKEKDKDEVMQDFINKKIDILVATTVVEVGVDVPNANIIIIENAERFGLSQLHQLRGRVGRGSYQSYCFLKKDKSSKTINERLKIMCETTDGFKISEKDLELRGAGDFFGTKQHGIPDFKIANLFEDIDILKKAQLLANSIINDDEYLLKENNILFKNKIDNMINNVL